MQEFEELLAVAKRLLGPNGCPWDKKQTLETLQKYLLEETHELLEAIDHKDSHEIQEELGDVFYVLIFICTLAEQKKLFTIGQVLANEKQKLVHRHPHVFGEREVQSMEEIWQVWDEMKNKEKGKKTRKSLLDGIPASLPLLVRAQKFFQRTRKKSSLPEELSLYENEERLGEDLLEILQKAEHSNCDAESALRRALLKKEQAFREKEKTTGDDL